MNEGGAETEDATVVGRAEVIMLELTEAKWLLRMLVKEV